MPELRRSWRRLTWQMQPRGADLIGAHALRPKADSIVPPRVTARLARDGKCTLLTCPRLQMYFASQFVSPTDTLVTSQ